MVVIAGTTIREERRAARGAVWGKVVEGLRYVWSRKIVLGSTSLDLFAVLLGGAVYLLPIFAERDARPRLRRLGALSEVSEAPESD